MANRIAAKERIGNKAVLFGALQHIDFDTIALAINQANTTVQATQILPFACKIPFAIIMADTASPGITAFNLVLGNAAEAGALVADNSDTTVPPTVNTTAGLSLFQNGGNTAPADQAVTLTAFTPQTFVTSVPDAIFPQNTVLTVRIVTGGTINGKVKVAIGMVPVDIYPMRPAGPNAFSWATDVG